MDFVSVEPPLCKTVEMIGFRILDNVVVSLFSSVSICIILTYRCGEKTWDEQKEMKLTDTEYNSWGSQDQYIIDLVKSKISELI